MHLSLIALIAWAPAPYALEAPIADVGRAGVAPAAADSAPAWFRRHLESLAGGSGRWTADNAAFKSEGEAWDAYGLEWTWGLGRQSVKGRLYAIQDGKDVGSFFEYWILWDPGARQALLIQYGSDGTYGVGVIEPDGTDGTAVEQTFYQPDGATTRVKHTDRHTGDMRVVQSFDWVDGAWRPRRLYQWKRAPVPAGPEAEQSDAGPPGRLVDIGGRRMHLDCLGSGRPTVVVDQGAGVWSVHWMHLHHALARTSRVCLFDRAGLGWSDAAPGPSTSRSAAQDLARTLEAAGETGPFALVGHSYGGYNVRVFRAMHPERVAGIVLVESGHEDQWTRLPAPLTEVIKGATAGLRELAAALRRGDAVPLEPVDSGYRDPTQRRLLEHAYRGPGPYEDLASTIEAIDSSTAQTRRTGSLDDLPLVVISARRSFDAFGHLPIDVEASNRVWYQLQDELAGLSTCAVHLWSESGDHNLNVTDPAIVIAGIGTLVEALSRPGDTGCPLTAEERQSR